MERGTFASGTVVSLAEGGLLSLAGEERLSAGPEREAVSVSGAARWR